MLNHQVLTPETGELSISNLLLDAMNGSRKPDPFQQLSSSLASLNSASPSRLQHSRNVARSSAASRIPNLSDAELKKFIDSTEKMLTDRGLLNSLPDSGQKLRDNLEMALAELRKREPSESTSTRKSTKKELYHENVPTKLHEETELSLVESMQSMKMTFGDETLENNSHSVNDECCPEPPKLPSDNSALASDATESPSTSVEYVERKTAIQALLHRTPDVSNSLSSLQLRVGRRSESPSTTNGPKVAKVLSMEEACELTKQHELARKEAQERHAQYVLTNLTPKSGPVSQPSDFYSRAHQFFTHREAEEEEVSESESEDEDDGAEEDIEEESEPEGEEEK